MFASKLITERRGRKSPMMWFLSLSAVLILLAADTLFAQTYQFSLQVRRLGDQVACEVWVKSLVPNAPKLGNFSYSINYKSDYLDPADPDNYPYYETDSVDMDVNQRPNPDNPFRVITSPYHSNNGYTAINMSPGADYLDASGYGWSSFQVAFNGDSITQGIKPATTGRGTFVAKFVFDIVDHSFNDTCTMGIGNHSRPYPSYDIHDIYSNTYSQGTGFTLIDPPVMKIRGISILNPRGPYEEVDRDAHYLSLPVGGYPVYFERSGLINTDSYSYGTPYVAYEVTYSVDEGSSWSNVMRFAETIDSIRAAQYDNFASGELETRYGGVPGYVVTQGNGDPLTAGGDGYGGVLRIIWADDSNFTGRSEKARIKFQQLSLTGVGSDIDLRSRLSISDSSAYNFDISRFFFTQLNGTNEYFKTASNYSNSTQLTVEAWVNLNTSVTYSAGDEPGIVASSGGPSSPGHGAWLLYLKDGRYPAFRAREIKDRGRNGGVFIDTIVSPDPLTAVNSAFLLTLDAASEVHRKNWTHIAATVNKDTLTLFVNGKIVAQKTNRTYNDIRMATFEHPIWIGVNPDISLDASDYLNAGIKEVKVWRKALNFEQIMQHAAGVYDPIGTITQISNIEGSTDLRRVLDIYYSFEANKFDIAGDQVAQGSEMGLDFYKADIADNPSISYRPDRAHIKLVTPIAGEGICNLEDVTYAIRWIGFGVGTVNPNSVDVNIEFSRDENKVFWELATDNTITPSGLYLDTVDMESAKAIWEPFNNVTEDGAYHDLQGVGNTIAENYTKQVYLKISGTSSHSQPDINDISDPFYVAPHFALRNLGEGSVYIPDNSDMNLSTGVSFIEAWINPYRFPTDDEEFFPIICKVDSVEGISHYSFRLLNTGRLQFVVVKADGSGDTVYSDATRPLVRPNETILDSVWTHVGVFLNLANGTGQSSIRFYID
ncbi:MAG: LamG protein, partial [Bacteroidota bacterium]|nr:LamG protein [Bacteroidota bacterium]